MTAARIAFLVIVWILIMRCKTKHFTTYEIALKSLLRITNAQPHIPPQVNMVFVPAL
jgi:hypothetical protein